MILAEVVHTKISTTENERNVMFSSEVLLRAKGSGERTRSGRFGEDLGAFEQQLQSLEGLAIGNHRDVGEMLLRQRERCV